MAVVKPRITKIRRTVFTEVARLAYEGGDYSRIENLPYKILPGETESYRDSIFLERAIIAERIRLAMGLPARGYTTYAPVSDGVNESAIANKFYDPPLVNIIKFACNRCPEKTVTVTDACRNCLARSCEAVCPADAVSTKDKKAVIDEAKCIKCGKCVSACAYHAIIKQERPCAASCGVNAMKSDDKGRASIDRTKCVSCGMCIVNCPFGAIADKGQIFQLIHAIKSGVAVYAAVAPSFVGQYRLGADFRKLRTALKILGFKDALKVAVGADLSAVDEAERFIKEVPDEIPFMATSCCPAWASMARKNFPEIENTISMSLTPMVITARLLKKKFPDCKVVFVGPCSAKKLEASRASVRSDVDFVLTFEELLGMMDACGIIDTSALEPETEEQIFPASQGGKAFAKSGKVADAIIEVIKAKHPTRGIKTARAEGLAECKKLLFMAKAGKYNGYLLEGMACPGGCLGGAGVIATVEKSSVMLQKYCDEEEMKIASENPLVSNLDNLD
ncbi:MAG: 4Fe-4S dicluster domain-containing protein [Christensenellaceae bacterium]|jgi:[FeFe] hydrogenase (group B1/B3)|nr:4Fe-4S dicluster domain-containing protein [Christensenellaceae bacterium]